MFLDDTYFLYLYKYTLELTFTQSYELDIKRWLGELRGKDMPESFAWSYKRYLLTYLVHSRIA